MHTGTRMLRGTDIAAMLAFRAMNTIHPTAKDTETEFFSQFLSLASVPEFFNQLIRLARLPQLRSPCVNSECGEAAEDARVALMESKAAAGFVGILGNDFARHAGADESEKICVQVCAWIRKSS